MKRTLLTTLLISSALFASAQTKFTDSARTATRINGKSYSVYFDVNKSDTVKVWFKEVIIIPNSYPFEVWKYGYMVTFPNKPIPIDEIPLLVNTHRKFLYNNKSTVKNTILTFSKQ